MASAAASATSTAVSSATTKTSNTVSSSANSLVDKLSEMLADTLILLRIEMQVSLYSKINRHSAHYQKKGLEGTASVNCSTGSLVSLVNSRFCVIYANLYYHYAVQITSVMLFD